MKIKWGKRTLTFMIIPDANHRVVRFRVSAFILYALPILILSGLCITLAVHLYSMQNKLEKQLLAAELENKTAAYEQTLHLKDTTIEQLQNELIDITAQSEEVKVKIEELKKLEAEINSITGNDDSESSDGDSGSGETAEISAARRGVVSIASASKYAFMTREEGIGGIELHLDQADTDELVAFTKKQLNLIDIQVDMLLTDISTAKEDLEEHLRMLRITPSIWPTDSRKVSSAYGYRKDPFTRKASYHEGIDISANSGEPVYATADGVVTFAGYDGGHGRSVKIKHASGLTTRYSHLKKYTVKEGQKVEKGEQIGEVGSTGRSTGPHLHYEIIKNGVSIDPAPYMETSGKDGN